MSSSSENSINITNYNTIEEDRFKKLIDTKEFSLIKENIKYNLKISKTKDKIFIRCNNYETKLNLDDFIKINPLFNICKTINDVYELILNLFTHNKVSINEIKKNSIIKLVLIMYNNIHCKDENIDITLTCCTNNKDSIINELAIKYHALQQDVTKIKSDYKLIYDNLSNLQNDINSLKKENSALKEQLKYLQEKQVHKITETPGNYDKIVQEKNKDPKKINFLADLTNDSYSHWGIDNTFSCFKTVDNKTYLVYSTEDFSILCCDLDENKMIKEISKAHDEFFITNFRHFFDKIKNRDLLLSISADNRNLKIWEIDNWECIINISNVYKEGYLYSAICLTEENKNYIITCNSAQNSESINIYDFYGIKIKEINSSNEDTYFIDSYYDIQLDKNFILTGNIGCVKSYDFKNNILYNKYSEPGNLKGHDSIVINNNNEIIKLIESCGDGFVRIWKFHSGEMIGKVSTGKNELRGICLWNNGYVFVACVDYSIKLVDIENEIVVKSLNRCNNEVCTVKKIYIAQYGGECLISQEWENDSIKIWTYNA